MRFVKYKASKKTLFKAGCVALVCASLAYLLLLLMYLTLVALSNALDINTYAANGTFQLYNPLRRLLDGQIIARDFPFFHGVGVPLLHYPVFHVMGQNIFAAELAKWLVSGLLFIVTTFAFYSAFFKNIKASTVATAVFAMLAVYALDIIYPGNSLLGVRTAFPVLVGAFMLWSPRPSVTIFSKKIELYWPILFTLIGLAIACGTEQGLAVGIAYMLTRLYQHIRSQQSLRTWWKFYIFEAVYLSSVVYAVLSLLTLGNANEAISYALVDIPKDQGWYFGAPPNDFLAWNTLNLLFSESIIYHLAPVILGGAATIIFAFKNSLLDKNESRVAILFSLYGIIVLLASITGYWAPGSQLLPLARVLGLFLVAILIRLFFLYIKNNSSHARMGLIARLASVVLFSIVCVHVFMLVIDVKSFPVRATLREVSVARHSDDYRYMGEQWKNRIDVFSQHIPTGSTIWSTYTSVYDSLGDQLSQSAGGEDYIIHALGPDRRENYQRSFTESAPDFVITLRPSYFRYEEWLWSRHWGLYKELLANYHLVADNSSHILWAKNIKTPPPKTTPTINLSPQGNTYRIHIDDSTRAHVYEVRVNYTVEKPFPLADKTSRYLIDINGTNALRLPVSLPPYEVAWTFPLVSSAGDKYIDMTPGSFGLVSSGLRVSSIQYREVTTSHENMYMFYDNACSFGGSIPDGYHNISKCSLDKMGLKNYMKLEK